MTFISCFCNGNSRLVVLQVIFPEVCRIAPPTLYGPTGPQPMCHPCTDEISLWSAAFRACDACEARPLSCRRQAHKHLLGGIIASAHWCAYRAPSFVCCSVLARSQGYCQVTGSRRNWSRQRSLPWDVLCKDPNHPQDPLGRLLVPC